MSKYEAAEWTVSPSDHTTLQVYHSVVIYYDVIYLSCVFHNVDGLFHVFDSDSNRRLDFEHEKT